MRIKKTIVSSIDKESRFVLKLTEFEDGRTFDNRKIAISNSMFSCEEGRKKCNKPLVDCPYQTHHIRWNKKTGSWETNRLKKAKKWTEENKRILLPHRQMNGNMWDGLNIRSAEKNFFMFEDYSEYIEYQMPLNLDIKGWKKIKPVLISKLSNGKKLFVTISSKHNIKHFSEIVKYEISNSDFLGISSSGQFKNEIEKANYNKLKEINSKLNVGQKCALIIPFDYPRIMGKQSNVAGSFCYSCFSGDILSEFAYFISSMKKDKREQILSTNVEEFLSYDSKQKKFNKSPMQQGWYGQDLTKTTLSRVSSIEGLRPDQVARYVSHLLQQRDLNLINELMKERKPIIDVIRDFTGWGVFWDSEVKNQLIQTPLNL